MSVRSEYGINIFINGKRYTKVVIDPHYEEKHSSSINDHIILELVYQLNYNDYEPTYEDCDFGYYMRDDLLLQNKKYKLIWLIDKKLESSYNL